jgi:hypothetical protein
MKKIDTKLQNKLLSSLEEEWKNFFQSNDIFVSDEIIQEIVLKSLENIDEEDETEEEDEEEDSEEKKDRIIN